MVGAYGICCQSNASSIYWLFFCFTQPKLIIIFGLKQENNLLQIIFFVFVILAVESVEWNETNIQWLKIPAFYFGVTSLPHEFSHAEEGQLRSNSRSKIHFLIMIKDKRIWVFESCVCVAFEWE